MWIGWVSPAILCWSLDVARGLTAAEASWKLSASKLIPTHSQSNRIQCRIPRTFRKSAIELFYGTSADVVFGLLSILVVNFVFLTVPFMIFASTSSNDERRLVPPPTAIPSRFMVHNR